MEWAPSRPVLIATTFTSPYRPAHTSCSHSCLNTRRIRLLVLRFTALHLREVLCPGPRAWQVASMS